MHENVGGYPLNAFVGMELWDLGLDDGDTALSLLQTRIGSHLLFKLGHVSPMGGGRFLASWMTGDFAG